MKHTLWSTRGARTGAISLLALVLVLGAALPQFLTAQADPGDLTVEILAGYNLVVDSNVQSPSTYAPQVATVAGKFCNISSSPLDDVVGYIGDYAGAGSGTPGTYPARGTSDPGFDAEHPGLAGTGPYAFEHLGGAADAARYIGMLNAGECSVQYWHFTYPACENSEDPPCSASPTWGDDVKPDDDLWLEFDVWGAADDGTTPVIYADQTWRMTMRNEISAMANKIEPNGNPGGQWFNTDTTTVYPGETITTNGILYRLGNINQGFDNDGNYVPDYNAWLQPFGDPSYDPSCFRLISTSGVLTVTRSGGNPDMIIPFDDQLYFTDLPPDNTNVVGEVFYEFLALGGACTIPISPYQEAASGFDNEKFNGDYGTGLPPLQTFEPDVMIEKTGNPAAVALNATITYQIGFENNSTTTVAGLTLSSGASVDAPMVINDTIPAGTTYVADSADFSLDYTPTSPGVRIVYLDSSTGTWTETQPAAANVAAIQWWLTDPLPTSGDNGSGYVTFQVTSPASAPAEPFIENCSDGRFADAPPFAESCTVTMIEGSNSIGDFVWWDANSDGIQDTDETGIDGVDVSLYYDKNGDSTLDEGDVFIATQTTVSGGAYNFGNLANGDFLVIVDESSSTVTTNRLVPTTTTVYAVTDLGGTTASPYNDADFGFGPVLDLGKTLSSSDPALEGQLVTWTLSLTNTRTGDGTGQASACEYVTYGNNFDASYTSTSGNGEWLPYTNAFGPNEPDGQFSASEYANVNEDIGITEFAIGAQPGSISTVDILLALRVINPGRFREVAGESLDIELIDTTTGTAIYSLNIPSTTLNSWTGTFTYPIPVPSGTVSGMTVADFTGSRYTISLIANGGGGNNSTYDAYLELDAAGFRVITDQTCGGPEDTVVTVPLTDEFDPSLFEFISADPLPDTVTTNTAGDNYNPAGLISWDNVGPLYAGQTKTVTVTLKALEPSTNPENTVNYARVRDAVFANGNPVNDDTANDDVDIVPAASIGDTIWNDNGAGGGTAGDGVQDPGETGLFGVTVSLTADRDVTINGVTYTTGSTIMTAVTDANGNYLFEGLPDAIYTVSVDNTSLTGMTATGGPHGITGNSTNVVVSGADVTTIAGNGCSNCEMDVDFGYTIPTLINGSVWNDHNQSGTSTPDDGEEGLTNVVVYVSDGSCNYPPAGSNDCPSVQTDSDGNFEVNLTAAGWTPAPGGTTYQVIVVPNSGDMSTGTWTQSFDTDGLGTPHQAAVTVIPGEQGRTDYSYYQTGSVEIDGTVYADWDGNAAQDAGENGFENVTVYLYEDEDGDGVVDPEDAQIASTQTDANGDYIFTNLPADTYIVVVDVNDPDLPNDYQQTEDPDETGPCVGAACDDMGSADASGGSVSNIDFGYQPVGYGSIGDYVWHDANSNGIQDVGETGISNITVNLYHDANNDGLIDSGDALMATAVTDADGLYSFVNLPAGNYLVAVDDTDADLPQDGNAQPYVLTTAGLVDVALASGENYLDADFGFAPGGMIGDFIWQDNDGDGLQDPNEPGINGVTVTLWYDSDGDGSLDASRTTTTVTNGGQDGYYEFTSLPGGDYRVEVTTVPAGFTLTSDPDAYGTNGVLAPPCAEGDPNYVACDANYDLTLTGGQSNRTADFGYQPTGIIGDYVWLDMDGDGVQDPGEQGIAGVTVYLYDSGSTLVDTTVTDLDGRYSFGDLDDDTYSVQVDTGTLPGGLTPTYDRDGGSDHQAAVELSATAGRTHLDVDFGYRYNATGSISGTVFFDGLDDGGIYDGGGANDRPYAGVPVYLYDSSGSLVASTYTDTSGYYDFQYLPDGDYTVAVNTGSKQFESLTENYEPDLTSTSAKCGDAGEPACDNSATATVSSGGNTTDQDFGFFSNMDLGDLINSQYATVLSSDGPSHRIGTLYLGASVDADPDGQANAEATGDDLDGNDDDDGLLRDPADLWDSGNTVHITATVTSDAGPTTGYLVGWFDWDNSGTFEPAEMVEFGALANAEHSLSLGVPSGWSVDQVGYYLKVRFRLYATDPGIPLPTGVVTNGEVEDYRWEFGPNAVSLAGFSANTGSIPGWAVALSALLLILVVGAAISAWRKREPNTTIHFR